jgi:hypothetical protein
VLDLADELDLPSSLVELLMALDDAITDAVQRGEESRDGGRPTARAAGAGPSR